MVALIGLIGPPMALVTCIGALYAYYGDIPALRRMLVGVSAAAAGLMIATSAKMARPLLQNGAIIAPLIALVTFAGIGILRWPLPAVLGVVLPVSIALGWVRR
jgi:chromate transporter